MKKLFLSLGILACLFVSGCATQQLSATATAGADLKSLKKVFVVHQPKDERGVDKLIAERLTVLGKQCTFGERSAAPADADAIVTYQDKWMWDMKMYLLELNVQVRSPKSDIALVSGHSFRTSLVRKSAPEMVEEVLTEMFKKG
jgi:hypothetical protein